MKITRNAIMLCIMPGVVILSCHVSLAQTNVAIREYTSENGRKIRITSTGNVIGLEMPAGYENIAGQRTREGYVVSYIDQYGITRVIHDVYDSYSTTFKSGERDLVPVSFTAPPSASGLAINTLISATAVLHTRDGLLRLENLITWRAGTGTVNVKMTIANRSANSSVKVLNLKRVADVNVARETLNTSVASSDFILFHNPLCSCPPPVPPGPWIPLVVFSGSNAIPLNTLASDDWELFNVGPGESLTGRQTNLDTQGVLVFRPNAPLPPLGSTSANVVHDIR
jgi:hypothetical protein